MSVIANFYLETPVLRRALRDVPDMAVSVEQQTATQGSPMTMIFWASGDDFEAFEEGLSADPTVTDSTVLAEVNGAKLYRIRLTERGEEVITYQSWAELGAIFLSADRSGDGWRLQLRFPDQESVQQYAEFCRENELPLELRRLYRADDDGRDAHGLTELQRETMLAAVEAGYFSVPREISTEELAERLDVSHQAVSERLRRGTETLIRSTLGDPDDGAEEQVAE